MSIDTINFVSSEDVLAATSQLAEVAGTRRIALAGRLSCLLQRFPEFRRVVHRGTAEHRDALLEAVLLLSTPLPKGV